MRTIKLFLLISITLFCFCCKKEEKPAYKYFEFSYDNTFETCFSMKITPGDSVYIREHWNGNYIFDSITPPIEKTNYIALITKNQRKELNELIAKIQLLNTDTIYYENYVDGRTYSLYIDKDSIKKTITVHSHNNVPKALNSLGGWIYQFKTKAKLIKTNKKLNFITSKYVLPPPPPLPIKK